MKLYIKLDEPFEWVRAESGRVEAFGEVPSVDTYSIADNDEVIGVVSGEWITSHKLNLPAKTRKQFNAALPFAMEDSITEDVEDMHFVPLNWRAGKECTVLSVSKSKMQEWQQVTSDYQLPIEQILPDYALLPLHDAADYMLAVNDERVLVRQRDGYGASFDTDILDLWVKNLPLNATLATNDKSLADTLVANYSDKDIRLWQVGDKLAHWLEHSQKTQSDVLTDVYRPKIKQQNKKNVLAMAAVILLAALGIKIFADGFRYLHLYRESQNLSTQMQELLNQQFPEVTNIAPGQERVVFEQSAKLGTSVDSQAGLQNLLAEVVPVIRSNKIELSNVSFRNEELILACEFNDFSRVDAITEQLKSNKRVSVELESSSANGNKVNALYKVKRS